MKYYVFFLLFIPSFAFCQVGINTSSPKAQLDIVSNSPDSPLGIDGILIPRIHKFPADPPTKDQHGMLVFLNSILPIPKSGFYFWNNDLLKWEALSGNASENFYKPATTASPNNITDPLFRNGNIGIGTQDITSKLQIALNSSADAAIKKGLEVDNNNPTVDNLTTYGIISDNRSATNGNKYGFKNNVGGVGNGIHYGFFNETYQNTGTNDIYGIFNRVGMTLGAKSSNFGIYSIIGNETSLGTIYGLYSVAIGSSTAKVFAGYFVGKVGIGMTPQDEYIFPATKGSNLQILALDNTGNLNWTYPHFENYISTTSTIGDYVITDEVGTLRINNDVNQLLIPLANINKGRIIRLMGWNAIGTKNLIFSNADNLYDVKTNSTITTIGANQLYTIQSAGNRWILLDR
ncbi:hypothetical protein [Gillisia sp. JM1]|uniref:hypothetical protein n=1 Tax=Gillisia sp. JM1 TaxID=1283286 RepID=UPI0004111DE7|nr:hypothetical protein [Gillisia sp. JM1]